MATSFSTSDSLPAAPIPERKDRDIEINIELLTLRVSHSGSFRRQRSLTASRTTVPGIKDIVSSFGEAGGAVRQLVI